MYRRHREQARSHSGSEVFKKSESTADPCGSELARDGGGSGDDELSGPRAKPVTAVGQVQPHGGAGGVRVLAFDGVEDRLVLKVGQLRQFA